MLLQLQPSSQNGGFNSEYFKLDRFLSVININKKSIEGYSFISYIYIFYNHRYILYLLVYCTAYDI